MLVSTTEEGVMYEASGVLAPLTRAELAALDAQMYTSQAILHAVYGENWASSPLNDDVTDVRRDVNAEWGSR